jgi:hypothetical protein
MDTLSIEITNLRAIDGLTFEASRAGLTPDVYAKQLLETLGLRAADDNRIGVITSAAFIARFSPAEYAGVIAASSNPAVAELVDQLTSTPNVALDDPRLAPGLSLLAAAGILQPGRVAELLSYDRPTPTEQAP